MKKVPDRVDDPVRAEFDGVVIFDFQTRFKRGVHEDGLFLHIVRAHMLHRVVEHGSDGRHDNAVDILKFNADVFEQVVQNHSEFVCGALCLG